jgi:hypothetical protein
MKQTNHLFSHSLSGKKEADIRIKIKTVNEKIETKRIERLAKKPLSIEEQIITGNIKGK